MFDFDRRGAYVINIRLVVTEGAVVGGGILGSIAAFIATFVAEIAREAFGGKRSALIPALVPIAYFGSALFLLAKFVSASTTFSLGSLVSVTLVFRNVLRDK